VPAIRGEGDLRHRPFVPAEDDGVAAQVEEGDACGAIGQPGGDELSVGAPGHECPPGLRRPPSSRPSSEKSWTLSALPIRIISPRALSPSMSCASRTASSPVDNIQGWLDARIDPADIVIEWYKGPLDLCTVKPADQRLSDWLVGSEDHKEWLVCGWRPR